MRTAGTQDTVDAAPTCSAAERRAWAGLVRVHAQMSRVLDSRMHAEQGYSATHYEIVAALSAAGGSLTISEVAAEVGLSPSRVSRVVDTLEADGLASRRRCATDGRVTYAALEPAGRRWLAGACGSYTDQLRRQFLDKLTPEQVRVLGDVWEALGDPDRQARTSGA